MTAATAEFTQGLYDGMPEQMYHSDPVPGGSLSSTGARKLLPPSCPARFRWDTDNPAPPKDELELGSAAHKMVLGIGAEIAVIKAKDWRSSAARDDRDAARAEGYLPLLTADHDRVQAMAAALRRHPVASAVFDPAAGRPEQSLFWQDQSTGIWKRARLDWLPDTAARERLIIADYKTTRTANPAGITKSVAEYGYHQQAPWYCDGAVALGLSPDPAFIFVFQEKDPPYLVTVAQLDKDALRIGRALNKLASEIYRDCTESGIWPGYSDVIELITLPPWAARRAEELAA